MEASLDSNNRANKKEKRNQKINRQVYVEGKQVGVAKRQNLNNKLRQIRSY